MKKIRSINPVSVGLVLLVAAAIYFGWKLIPVYWQAHKVQNALEAGRSEAMKINLIQDDPREERILEDLVERIRDMGVQDDYLDVYFMYDYSEIHAEYSRDIEFFWGKTWHKEFHRKVTVPRDDLN